MGGKSERAIVGAVVTVDEKETVVVFGWRCREKVVFGPSSTRVTIDKVLAGIDTVGVVNGACFFFVLPSKISLYVRVEVAAVWVVVYCF